MNLDRSCNNCKGAIPDELRADAKYCSEDCRIQYNHKRKREKRRDAYIAKQPQQVLTSVEQEPLLIHKRSLKPLESFNNSDIVIDLLRELSANMSALNAKFDKFLSGQTKGSGDLLTVEEATEYLNVCKTTLYKLVKEGKIESKKIGRRIYILPD